MKFSRYFKKKFWSSFWVLAFLAASLVLTNNFRHIQSAFSSAKPADFSKSLLPLKWLPKSSDSENYVIYPQLIINYNVSEKVPIYSYHVLNGKNTRGNASRRGVDFKNENKVGIRTAKWSDFLNSGFDRGHLTPAADFQCCQVLLENTFTMANIAAFDSTLNRHAWQSLEILTRKWARKYQQLYVITGTVYTSKSSLFSLNQLSIPTHFYKIIFRFEDKNQDFPIVAAFLLPNDSIYKFDKTKYAISIDELESLTGLDFFERMEDKREKELESKINISW